MPNIRKLCPELEKIAIEELNERPEMIEEEIKALKAWISATPHIKSRTDDQFLVTFLRGCKYDVESAKKKIEAFYEMRKIIPDFFSGRDPSDERLREILRLGICLPLPELENPGAPRVTLIRITNFDPSKYKFEEMVKIIALVSDICAIEDDNFVIAGQILVIDFAKSQFSHLRQLTPKLLKKFSAMSKDGSPVRMQGYHFINTPMGFDTLFSIYKGLASIPVPMIVHGKDLNALYKHIPSKIFPSDYDGASGASIETIVSSLESKLLSYEEYFKEDAQFGIIEQFRPSKK